jgi:hypothetical protein
MKVGKTAAVRVGSTVDPLVVSMVDWRDKKMVVLTAARWVGNWVALLVMNLAETMVELRAEKLAQWLVVPMAVH